MRGERACWEFGNAPAKAACSLGGYIALPVATLQGGTRQGFWKRETPSFLKPWPSASPFTEEAAECSLARIDQSDNSDWSIMLIALSFGKGNARTSAFSVAGTMILEGYLLPKSWFEARPGTGLAGTECLLAGFSLFVKGLARA